MIEEHHHAGLGLMTPDQTHFGQAEAIHTARQATLTPHYSGHTRTVRAQTAATTENPDCRLDQPT